MPIFKRPDVLTALLEYIDLGWAPCFLLRFIGTFHFKPSCCSYIYKCILLEFATIMPALNIVLFVLLPS